MLVFLYREFFQQDVDEFGFGETSTDQIIDPTLSPVDLIEQGD